MRAWPVRQIARHGRRPPATAPTEPDQPKADVPNGAGPPFAVIASHVIDVDAGERFACRLKRCRRPRTRSAGPYLQRVLGALAQIGDAGRQRAMPVARQQLSLLVALALRVESR
jgi:hypothetical protein